VIRAYASESFPITVALEDISSGQTVLYDIRQQVDDIPLSPPLSGVLPESDSIPGVYTTTVTIDEVGSYFVYVSCQGFLSEADEIIIEQSEEVSFSPGCYVPEVISESLGSINMVINKDNIRFSTKGFIPSISASFEE
jgi:hypothetical protein